MVWFISLSFMVTKALRMIQKSFSSPNISLLLFWLRLGCVVLVNRLFLLVILTLTPLSSPLWPREFRMVNGLIWSVLLPLVEEFLPLLLVNANLTKIRVLVGTFFWHVLLLWLLPLHVMSRPTAGLLLILLFVQNSLSLCLGCHC